MLAANFPRGLDLAPAVPATGRQTLKLPPASVARTLPLVAWLSTNSPSKNWPRWVPPAGLGSRHAHLAVGGFDDGSVGDLPWRSMRLTKERAPGRRTEARPATVTTLAVWASTGAGSPVEGGVTVGGPTRAQVAAGPSVVVVPLGR